MYPLPPSVGEEFFAHFWIEAALDISGCWVVYNKYYAMIKTKHKSLVSWLIVN